MALLGCACQEKLPSAPSDVANGVAVYEHANFGGRSAFVNRSLGDLKDFDGPCETEISSSENSTTTTIRNWNDCISSIKVSPGWRATIYRDTDFRGQSVELTADAPNLQLVAGSCDHDGLNDCISSIRVVAP